MSETQKEKTFYCFDEFTVDPQNMELRHGSEVITIQRKSFDLLLCFVKKPLNLMSINEILKNVWPEQGLSENVVKVTVGRLRKLLGLRKGKREFIENVYGQGYRFTAPVKILGYDAKEANSYLDPQAAAVSRQAGIVSDSDITVNIPFIGRNEELLRMTAALEDVRAGHGSLIALLGEPGIGKTRLAEVFEQMTPKNDFLFCWARCREGLGIPPFWTWIQIIRECLIREPIDFETPATKGIKSVLSRLLPELRGLHGAALQPPFEETEKDSFRIYDAITRFLSIISNRRNLILIIDDLHLGDLSTFKLLGHILTDTKNLNSLIIVTLRDTERLQNDKHQRSLSYVIGHPNCHRISLQRLTKQDIFTFTEELLDKPDEQLSTEVYKRSEGNPFFATELLRPFMTQHEAKAIGLEFSTTALDIIRRRIEHLESKTLQLLSMAAVIGRSFSFHLLEDLSGFDKDTILQCLEKAINAYVIQADQGSAERFSFVHALIRESLYEELSLNQRAKFHLIVAKALEKRYEAGSDVGTEKLAHHFYLALPHDDPIKAVEYLKATAETAASASAYESAAEHYKLAYEVIVSFPGIVDSDTHCSVLLGLGRSLQLVPFFNDAKQAYEKAANLARREKRYREFALAAMGLRDCEPAWFYPAPLATSLLNEALQLLPEHDKEMRARVFTRLAKDTSAKTRRMALEQALELASDCETPIIQAELLVARLYNTLGPDKLDERERLAVSLQSIAEEQRDMFWYWEALSARYEVYLRRGDRLRAEEVLEEFSDSAAQIEHPHFHLEGRRLKAIQAAYDGQVNGSIEVLEDLAEQIASLQFPYTEQILFTAKSRIAAYRGDREETTRIMAQMARRFKNISNKPWFELSSALGYYTSGNIEKAREIYTDYAAKGFENLPDNNRNNLAFHAARLCSRFGDVDNAKVLYEMLQPYASQNVVLQILLVQIGSVALALAELAWLLEKFDAAEQHFQNAIAMAKKMNSYSTLFEAQLIYSAFLIVQNRSEDGVKEMLEEVRAESERLGLGLFLNIAKSYLKRLD